MALVQPPIPRNYVGPSSVTVPQVPILQRNMKASVFNTFVISNHVELGTPGLLSNEFFELSEAYNHLAESSLAAFLAANPFLVGLPGSGIVESFTVVPCAPDMLSTSEPSLSLGKSTPSTSIGPSDSESTSEQSTSTIPSVSSSPTSPMIPPPASSFPSQAPYTFNPSQAIPLPQLAPLPPIPPTAPEPRHPSCNVCGPLNWRVSNASGIVNLNGKSFSCSLFELAGDWGVFDAFACPFTPEYTTNCSCATGVPMPAPTVPATTAAPAAALRCHNVTATFLVEIVPTGGGTATTGRYLDMSEKSKQLAGNIVQQSINNGDLQCELNLVNPASRVTIETGGGCVSSSTTTVPSEFPEATSVRQPVVRTTLAPFASEAPPFQPPSIAISVTSTTWSTLPSSARNSSSF